MKSVVFFTFYLYTFLHFTICSRWISCGGFGYDHPVLYEILMGIGVNLVNKYRVIITMTPHMIYSDWYRCNLNYVVWIWEGFAFLYSTIWVQHHFMLCVDVTVILFALFYHMGAPLIILCMDVTRVIFVLFYHMGSTFNYFMYGCNKGYLCSILPYGQHP